jgi:hypothetical protein
MKSPPTIAEYNERKDQLWAQEGPLTHMRMADPLIRDLAFARLNSEQRREVPVRSQITLEAALHEAAAAANTISNVERCNFARKGGRAKPQSEVQSWFDSVVGRNSRITTAQVIEKARCEQGNLDSIIIEVTNNHILFQTTAGIQSVALNAVKYRLSRAKKKFRLH